MPVDVSQLLALSDDLKKSGRKVRAEVVKAVAETTKQVETDMKAAAPLGPTGDLRNSIEGVARGLTGRVGTDIRYAQYVQWGSVHNPEPVDFLNPPADAADGTFPTQVEEAVIKAMDL